MNEQEAAKAAAMNQVTVDGDFQCQTPGCNDGDIQKALYLPEVKVLTWICKYSHKSYIEDINLG